MSERQYGSTTCPKCEKSYAKGEDDRHICPEDGFLKDRVWFRDDKGFAPCCQPWLDAVEARIFQYSDCHPDAGWYVVGVKETVYHCPWCTSSQGGLRGWEPYNTLEADGSVTRRTHVYPCGGQGGC